MTPLVKDNLVTPVLKWVGGKRQLLETFKSLLPSGISAYCEPFVGGGALFFELQPPKACINDINEELMRVYAVIRDDVEVLIGELRKYRNEASFFYALRDLDRDKKKYAALSDVRKAARILYLNKTCYNGLYRVNNAGEFNSPFGRYVRPNIVNEAVLRAVHAYFHRADVTISSMDYSEVLQKIDAETFVYLDPPYAPVTETACFTGYTRGGFSLDEQVRLKECCDDLNRRGVKFMLSNSATDFIKKLYGGYDITVVRAKRSVNSVGTLRGDVDEVVVRNYA